jgi:hypothetical protein
MGDAPPDQVLLAEAPAIAVVNSFHDTVQDTLGMSMIQGNESVRVCDLLAMSGFNHGEVLALQHRDFPHFASFKSVDARQLELVMADTYSKRTAVNNRIDFSMTKLQGLLSGMH